MIKLGQIGIGCIQEGPSMKIHSHRATRLNVAELNFLIV